MSNSPTPQIISSTFKHLQQYQSSFSSKPQLLTNTFFLLFHSTQFSPISQTSQHADTKKYGIAKPRLHQPFYSPTRNLNPLNKNMLMRPGWKQHTLNLMHCNTITLGLSHFTTQLNTQCCKWVFWGKKIPVVLSIGAMQGSPHDQRVSETVSL